MLIDAQDIAGRGRRLCALERRSIIDTITSVNNKTVKRLALLRDRSKARREAQSFVIEGIRMVADADPAMLSEIYMTEALLAQNRTDTQRSRDLQRILAHAHTVPTTIVTEEVLRKISDTETPQGVLAVARMPQHTLAEMLAQTRQPLLLVCEDVQDPGNLGTMIRTAEAAGVTGIILSKGCVDPYNPKVVRATMTAIFREPIMIADDLAAAMGELRTHGILTYAAYLDPHQTIVYDEPDYTGGTAFLIGNEGNGLRQETAEAANMRIRIPMQGQIESLNAAMSAGILMYEAARQRLRRVSR